MSEQRRLSVVMFAVLLSFALFPLGCSSEPASTTTGDQGELPPGHPMRTPAPTTPPPAPDVAIELSDPEAKLVNTFVKNQQGQEVPVRVVHWKVKYRFTKGQPQAGKWYTCQAEFSLTGMKQFEGSQMAAEGVFESDTPLFAKSDPPTTVEFTVRQGNDKNSLDKLISNTVTTDVQNLIDSGVKP